MVSTSTATSRMAQQGQDYLGRWTYALLATKQDSMICFVTAYKPCQTSISTTGPWTVHRQQWVSLRTAGTTNPNPRDQFDQDLLQFLQDMIQQGHRIVLMGDFNGCKQSSIFTKLYDLGLRDAIHDRHYNLPSFRSYSHGTKVIDYFLCSSSLLPFITTSTYEPFGYSSSSDH